MTDNSLAKSLARALILWKSSTPSAGANIAPDYALHTEIIHALDTALDELVQTGALTSQLSSVTASPPMPSLKLEHKINQAIKLLQSIPTDTGPIEVSYSGGKDSDVILELAKMAAIPYRAIYKNTTIDPPGTVAHCKSKGVEVFAPAITFLDLVKKKGCPTRRARFCCEYLKEYKVLDRVVQGIRRCESVARHKRYKEPEICREYGNGDARVYLPILEWTDEDVTEFIAERGIRCHPLYYDEQGNFHVERRLGCIGCPLQADNGKMDYTKYPKLLKQLIKSAQIWMDAPHSRCTSPQKFGNAYNLVFHNLFCKTYEEFQHLISGGLFPEIAIDAKTFMEGYFKIDLTI